MDTTFENFEKVRIFEYFRESYNGSFEYKLTEAGAECDFLKFLINTCRFRDVHGEDLSEDTYYINKHLANKLTALGFFMTSHNLLGDPTAVIALDHVTTGSEASLGCTGKTLFGKAISECVKQVAVAGRLATNSDTAYSCVDRLTKNIVIDVDHLTFHFKKFYEMTSYGLEIKSKCKKALQFPPWDCPKIYLTSTDAIKTFNYQELYRIPIVWFSDWYNPKWTPSNDFGNLFFYSWDEWQRILFYNLMHECKEIRSKCLYENWNPSFNGIVECRDLAGNLYETRNKG